MQVRWWWLVVLAACVVEVDGQYVAGDDVDHEDAATHPQTGGPVTFDDQPQYIDWHNDQGTFRIYKLCLGPNPGPLYIGHDGTVGPGYVATVWNRDHAIVLDDTAIPAHVGPNGGIVNGQILGATGLGMFGFHLLRKHFGAPTPYTIRQLDATGHLVPNGYNDAWQISGRWCNANRRPDDYGGYRGWGVRSFSTPSSGYYVAPKVISNVGQFAMDVTLGDAYSDLVVVRYTYRIGFDYVKTWVRVTNVCSDGTCDDAAAGGDAFIKEPKVIAGVNPADADAVGLEQINLFNDTGHTAVSTGKYNTWSAPGCSRSPAKNLLCEWGARDPRADDGGGTGQCTDPQRRRARFWNPHVACASDPSCLVVAARGADTELGPSYPWQGPHGLDLWAQRNVSEGREQADPHDSKADGYLEHSNCWNNSAAPQNRRWELIGYDKTPGCSYRAAATGFHGWEGGTGTYDCEPLYYRFGHSPPSARESYVVALSYGFGAAPLP